MNNFIVLKEYVVVGKTTTTKLLSERIKELGYETVYNHGAMTYILIQEKSLKRIQGKKDMPITVSYFFTDLIINTKNIIKPYLTKKKIQLCYKIDILMQ